MAGARFPGGAVLETRPSQPAGSTLRRLPAPPRVYLPMLQHQGEPARPCVEIGTRVLRGQCIGVATSALSAPVHASCSGTVSAITARDIGHPSGRLITCVEIDSDDSDGFAHLPTLADWQALDRAAITARLHEAGVVGLGGAVFPTALKLEAAAAPVHTLIVNGAESDPLAGSDDAVMRHRADDVIAGALLLAQALSATRVLVAVNDALDDAAASLHRACADNALARSVRIVAVPSRYPQGSERQLLYTLTGIALGHGSLPHEHGVLTFNVATAAAAWRAVVHGEPVTSRVLRIAGDGVRQPCTLEVPLGTPIADLVAAAGGYGDDARRLLVGGAMMGRALPHDDIPIGKGTYSVLVLSSAQVPGAITEMPCIRCGECARVCPSRLLPQRLLTDIRQARFDESAARDLHDCIECGLCDTVCPSHIPLLHWLRHGKGELAFATREQALSDRSRLAHHARNERLAQLAEERAQTLAARERGSSGQSRSALPDVLAAALAKARAGKRDSDDTPPS